MSLIRRAARALSAGNHGTFCARQVLLQPLQERHEIPDGEDMIFHESPQILDGSDLRVNGVVQQPRAKGGEAVTVLFRHV
jgi:hypothetical protein